MFKGKWIRPTEFEGTKPLDVFHRERETAKFTQADHPEQLRNLHMLTGKEFTYSGGKCILNVSADDRYKLFINGKFICQGPAPGYFFAYNFNSVDISRYLSCGTNKLVFDVYYQGLINRVHNSGDLRCGLICDLYEDGVLILCTDESWKYSLDCGYISKRKIGYDTQYLEDYDINAEKTAEGSVSVWADADYTFVKEPFPTLTEYTLELAEKKNLNCGAVFYDFGREITASLIICANAKKGAEIRILCGEETEDTEFITRYNMRCGCSYDEKLILADGYNEHMQYDYKAFRYVTLVPTDGVIDFSVKAAVRHAAFDDEYCNLITNDTVLKEVFELCKYTAKIGTQEVFVDCPTREKGQYAGDMTVSAASYTWLTGDVRMLKKAAENQLQSAFTDSGIMAVTPGSHMQEIADYSLQLPLVIRRYYDFTQDLQFVKNALPVLDGMIEYFRKYSRRDGLLDGVDGKWNLVDWPVNLRDSYEFPLTNPIGKGIHNVINAFYVISTGELQKLKDICGVPYTDSFTPLKESFNRAFFNEKTGVYTDCEHGEHSSLHSNIIAPMGGFAPDNNNIAELIIQKGLCCGVYMSFFALKSLCALGEFKTAYELITSQSENSWFNMIKQGATTCFEAWGKEKKWNTSLCHPWAGAPVTVLIEDICGIYPGKNGISHAPKGTCIVFGNK